MASTKRPKLNMSSMPMRPLLNSETHFFLKIIEKSHSSFHYFFFDLEWRLAFQKEVFDDSTTVASSSINSQTYINIDMKIGIQTSQG